MNQESSEPTFTAETLIGKTTEEATKFIASFGYTLRVTRKNNSPCIVTRDYRIDRINVAIENDLITEVRGVG